LAEEEEEGDEAIFGYAQRERGFLGVVDKTRQRCSANNFLLFQFRFIF
jgi:hypothetical protein